MVDTTIQKILSKELYKGDYVHGKRTKHPTYYENVVEPIVSKEKWNNCQIQKLRNARHYERTATYLFTNKLVCSKCGRFLGGKATTKKSGKKYYYYKCEHCKINFKEQEIEQNLLFYITEIINTNTNIKSQYTPFIKQRYTNKQTDYDKQIKDLDKQMDRIKTAYIKGILKLADFDKEIKHIEFQKNDLTIKMQEQKQYENLSFITQDLLIFKNTQNTIFYDFSNWNILLRKEKQKIISNYIDNLVIERKNDKTNIIESNYRSSFIENLIN